MSLPATSPWIPRWSTFVLALLLGASVVYWVLRWPLATTLSKPELAEPVSTAPVVATDARAMGRLWGADSVVAVTPSEASSNRFRLMGVVADPRGAGAAVIAVDGQSARSFRVGSTVAPGLVLQSVGPGRASLAPDASAPASVVLEVPRNGRGQ